MEEVSCLQTERWHWFPSTYLYDILACHPNKVLSPFLAWLSPCWPLVPWKDNKKWLRYFTFQKIEDPVYEVNPNVSLRLNMEMTLTQKQNFHPKICLWGTMSHWMGPKDSAGLKTADCCCLPKVQFSIRIWKSWQYTIFLWFFFL